MDQQASEKIVAHLADHGGAHAVLVQGSQEIARRTAGVGGQDRITCFIYGMGSEINEKLSQSNNIKHQRILLLCNQSSEYRMPRSFA